MEISIERSPQHWCPSVGFELTTIGSRVRHLRPLGHRSTVDEFVETRTVFQFCLHVNSQAALTVTIVHSIKCKHLYKAYLLSRNIHSHAKLGVFLAIDMSDMKIYQSLHWFLNRISLFTICTAWYAFIFFKRTYFSFFSPFLKIFKFPNYWQPRNTSFRMFLSPATHGLL